MSKDKDIRVRYEGKEYRVVLGPPYFVEQRNGALIGSGMPSIVLADPETGYRRYGLTVEIPEAPLKPGQVLVGSREEGLRALTEAGVVRPTGEFYRSREYGATFPVCDLLLDAPGPQEYRRGEQSLDDLQKHATEKAVHAEESKGKGLGK